MDITTFDLILVNAISYLMGLLTGLSICCKYKEKFLQRSKSVEGLSQYNHQRIVQQDSPIIHAQPQPSAPTITEIKLSQ